MPSEKVVRLLQTNTELSRRRILTLTETGAWRTVYADIIQHPGEQCSEICFVGYPSQTTKAFQRAAELAGFETVSVPSPGQTVLVVSEDSSPELCEEIAARGLYGMETGEFEQHLRRRLTRSADPLAIARRRAARKSAV